MVCMHKGGSQLQASLSRPVHMTLSRDIAKCQKAYTFIRWYTECIISAKNKVLLFSAGGGCAREERMVFEQKVHVNVQDRGCSHKWRVVSRQRVLTYKGRGQRCKQEYWSK